MTILTRSSTLPWKIHIHFLTYLALSIGFFAAEISYSDHCSAFVPEAVSGINSNSIDTSPFSQHHVGYCSGNLSSSSSSSNHYLTFETRDVQKTDREGVFKVEADLRIRVPNYDGFYVMESSYRSSDVSNFISRRSSRRKRNRSWFLFPLEGFWSEPSGKLCMVGADFLDEGDGDPNLGAVLKMENIENSANITSLFTGTLESLSSAGDQGHRFGAVSLLMFPQINYQHSLVTEGKEAGGSFGVRSSPAGLSLESGSFCRTFQEFGHQVKLTYAANCVDPTKNCTPFAGHGHLDPLPRIMSWRALDCSESERRMRVLLYFSGNGTSRYSMSFSPNTTLVGEGLWVERKNLLEIVACRIHTDEGSFFSARVTDCSIGLSISFPATWSIKERSGMLGELKSKKSTAESGYFRTIAVRDTQVSVRPGLKYKYTEAEKVKRLCPAKKHESDDNQLRTYPDRFSHDLSFDMSVQTSGGKNHAWGYSYPVFVGNRAYNRFAYEIPVSTMNRSRSVIITNSSNESRFSVAYQMTLSFSQVGNETGTVTGNGPSILSETMEISAEGVYDMENGGLCMVGCKSLEISKPDSMDCEVLINLQFPPLDSEKAGDVIRGSITSTRERSDPLYFDGLNISASSFYIEASVRTIQRLDLEVSLVLVSNALLCIFAGSQILYARKHPQFLPFVSVLMVVILSLGSAIPLALNFDALFLANQTRQTYYLNISGRWFKANEVLVRVATLVVFLFQFCLLQLSLSSRGGEAGHGKSSVAEKKALLLSLPLYAVGAFAALLANWKIDPENSVWGTLNCYGGLVLDGFLLPQILLNVLRDSNEKVLSIPFYVGTTLVRLVPHGYDLWRGRSFIQTRFDGSYVYGVPGADFYSTAWDVIIPIGGIVFAAVVYLQQRFGGCCIVPRRFRRNSVDYEKLSVVGEA